MRVPPYVQFDPAASMSARISVFVALAPGVPFAPVAPLQTNCVPVISATSSVPLPLSSDPELIFTPPLAQFAPADSWTTAVSARALALPWSPLQMYPLELISLASSTPLLLASRPAVNCSPPLGQFVPAASSRVSTSELTALPALQTYWLLVISDA